MSDSSERTRKAKEGRAKGRQNARAQVPRLSLVLEALGVGLWPRPEGPLWLARLARNVVPRELVEHVVERVLSECVADAAFAGLERAVAVLAAGALLCLLGLEALELLQGGPPASEVMAGDEQEG